MPLIAVSGKAMSGYDHNSSSDMTAPCTVFFLRRHSAQGLTTSTVSLLGPIKRIPPISFGFATLPME